MTSPSVPSRRRRSLPGTWWGIALVIAVPVIVLAAAAIAILLLTVHPVDAKDRIELIKAGLGVGAGTGGVVALVLAGRRQWATEESDRITEHDATERRATELYAKAAEQLGSDQAPVRLSGLYALERLGDAHPTLRQTVVNLLCAYLRMPFDHRGEPAEAGSPDSEYHITAGHRIEFVEFYQDGRWPCERKYWRRREPCVGSTGRNPVLPLQYGDSGGDE